MQGIAIEKRKHLSKGLLKSIFKRPNAKVAFSDVYETSKFLPNLAANETGLHNLF